MQTTPASLESADLRWFVVTGASRSGTTLLAMLLNTHPEVGCLREVGLAGFIQTFDALFDVGRDRERLAQSVASPAGPAIVGDGLPGAASLDPSGTPSPLKELRTAHGRVPLPREAKAKEFLDRRDAERLWARFDPAWGVLDARLHSTKVARALFEIAVGKSGLTRLGTKLPNLDLVAMSRLLADRLPNMRFVHIVRRPMSVVNSSLARRNNASRGADVWHIANVQDACREWIADWHRAVSSRAVLGDRLLLLKYADLAAQAGPVGRLIADHLQLDNRFDFSIFEPLPAAFEGYALTPEEAGVAEACFDEIERAWDRPLQDLFQRFPRFGSPLDASGTIRFGLGGNGGLYQSDGFHVAEPWGCCTDGERARLDVLLPDTEGDVVLDMHFSAWRVEADKPFEFVVAVGATRQLISLGIPTEGFAYRRSILVPRSALPNPRHLTIELVILTPKMPADPPLAETRHIGIGFRTIQVRFLRL